MRHGAYKAQIRVFLTLRWTLYITRLLHIEVFAWVSLTVTREHDVSWESSRVFHTLQAPSITMLPSRSGVWGNKKFPGLFSLRCVCFLDFGLLFLQTFTEHINVKEMSCALIPCVRYTLVRFLPRSSIILEGLRNSKSLSIQTKNYITGRIRFPLIYTHTVFFPLLLLLIITMYHETMIHCSALKHSHYIITRQRTFI